MQSVYATFRSHALAISAAIPPRHLTAHALAADAASRVVRICDEGLVREAASPEAGARQRALRLRAAALCCPVVGFAAHAAWEAVAPAIHGAAPGEGGKAAALGASIFSVLVFIAMLGAVYSLLAAARAPAHAKSAPGEGGSVASPARGGSGGPAPQTRPSGNSPGVELGF